MADEFMAADLQLQNRTMISLAECDEYPYDTWCYLRGVDPADPVHIEHYSIMHTFYVALWNRLGPDDFFIRLERGRAIMKALKR